MKIKWNKLAKRQWQGSYKEFDFSINPIGEAGYQYLIYDGKGKLISSEIEKKFKRAVWIVKKIVRSNGEYFW